MSLIRINHHPSRQQLRVFAIAWLVCFGSLAFAMWTKSRTLPAVWIGGFALGVSMVGLVAPKLLRVVYLGMTYMTFPIGWVLSHVILAVVYYFALTPIGWILRLVQYDPLTRRFDRTASTYWKTRAEPSAAERYFRQH